MLKVFLSSTFKDLIAERKAVEAAVTRMSATYVGMEHFGSFSAEPLDRCLERVRASDVLVLVLADRYGYVPDGSDVSMTESEYHEARRIKLPILPYFRQKDERFARIMRFSPEGKESPDPRLASFRAVIQESHGVSWFCGPDDLAWKVAADLYREIRAAVGEVVAIDKARNAVLYDPVKNRIAELVAILEHRAERIESELHKFYRYAKVKKYLAQFKSLHKKHVKCLQMGNLIEAHELLAQIHEMSTELESDEFWASHRAERPNMSYKLRRDAFQRGRIICEYVAGDMTPYSERYPSDEGFRSGMWRDGEVSPVVSAGLYQKMLSQIA